jgi:hypothetical protein
MDPVSHVDPIENHHQGAKGQGENSYGADKPPGLGLQGGLFHFDRVQGYAHFADFCGRTRSQDPGNSVSLNDQSPGEDKGLGFAAGPGHGADPIPGDLAHGGGFAGQ